MKLVLVYLFVCMIAFSCSKNESGQLIRNYDEACIKGHTYYKSHNLLANKLNDDGTPVKCSMKESNE